MNQSTLTTNGVRPLTLVYLLLAVAISLGFPIHLSAQDRSPEANAPFDLTGYWVSSITKNWRMRMVTPAKGDYQGIPLNDAAKRVADNWDPAKDQASGNACRSYGAGIIMNVPGRLHITWADGETMKMEIDSGTQTRLFHFGNWKPSGSKPSLQGNSIASWVAKRGPGVTPSTPKARYLKVTTSHMLSGYLRKNGVPYSDNATLTEYYDVIQEQDGETVLVVTSVLEDPVYLVDPYILSSQYKKQKDSTGWDPTPCSSIW
jgi:hypothetical protein